MNWAENILAPLVTNWPLIAVAVWGIIVAIRTLRVLREQTQATRIAAEATKDSVETMIKTERAWVVAELKPNAFQGWDKRWYLKDNTPLSIEQLLRGDNLTHYFRLTNIGRTAAQILSYEIRFSCLPENVTDLPPNPPISEVERIDFAHLLGANESIEISELMRVHDVMQADWEDIKALRKTAVFHGVVSYRHLFTISEDCSTTNFCYVFTVSMNRLTAVGRHTKYK